MKKISFFLPLFIATIIFSKSYCQSPFALDDLNSVRSFYGYWEGSFSFTNIATKKLVVIQISEQSTNTVNLVVYDKEKATATRYYSTFENGTIRFPFTVISMGNTNDSCKGTVSISLLDGQHITGSFLSTKSGCTALQVAATKTDERSIDGLLNFKSIVSSTGSNAIYLRRFIGTWEGYGNELDSSNVKPEFNYISKLIIQPFKGDNEDFDTLLCQLFIRNLNQKNGGATLYLRGVADGTNLRLLDYDSSAFTKEVRIVRLQKDNKGTEFPVLQFRYIKENKQPGLVYFSFPYQVGDNKEDKLSEQYIKCLYLKTSRDSSLEYKNSTCLSEILVPANPKFDYLKEADCIRIKYERLMPIFIRIDKSKVLDFLAQQNKTMIEWQQFELPTFGTTGINYSSLNVIMPVVAIISNPALDKPINFPQPELSNISFAQLVQTAVNSFKQKKQIDQANVTKVEPPVVVDNNDEKAAVQQAARAFLKWYEQIGEKQFYFEFVLNKYGKPADEEDPCPCTINQKAVNDYSTWLKKNSAYFSELYVAFFDKEITRLRTEVKNLKKTDFDFVEDVAITKYPVYTGNGGNPEFGKEGFYTDNNKVKWEITILTSGKASINIIYPSSAYPMHIEMVQENGVWKLSKAISVKLQ